MDLDSDVQPSVVLNAALLFQVPTVHKTNSSRPCIFHRLTCVIILDI